MAMDFNTLDATNKVYATFYCMRMALSNMGYHIPAVNGSALAQNTIDWEAKP